MCPLPTQASFGDTGSALWTFLSVHLVLEAAMTRTQIFLFCVDLKLFSEDSLKSTQGNQRTEVG